MMKEPPYWVEAKLAVKDRNIVIGYSVWTLNAHGGRYVVTAFRVTKRQSAEKALSKANRRRDELNRV